MSFCAQSKVPESTMAPPIALPWPDRNLVVECTTISAPCWIGWHKNGVAIVLSINKGIPTDLAIELSALISETTPPGFASDSPNIALTLEPLAASSTHVRSSKSTNLQFQLNFLNVFPNWVIEPPYNFVEAINVSPGSIIGKSARSWAECPEAVHVAPLPFSREDIFSSKTAVVGFDNRE